MGDTKNTSNTRLAARIQSAVISRRREDGQSGARGVERLADQGWYFWYGITVSHPGNTAYLWSIVQESQRRERFGGNEVEARQKNRESRIQHAREKSQADRPRRECVNAANDLLSPTARSPLH